MQPLRLQHNSKVYRLIRHNGIKISSELSMKTGQELKFILGRNVISRRKDRKWSQEKLAETVNVSRNVISDIETGQRFVRAQTLVNLANAFETEVYELLKPEGILPDKPMDLIMKYSEEVREKVEEIGNFFMKKMKGENGFG